MKVTFQHVLEAGFMGVFLFFSSGGLPLLMALVEGRGYVINGAAPQKTALGYPVGDYAVYTGITAAISTLFIVGCLTIQKNSAKFRMLMPLLVLFVILTVWLLVAEGMA